jgi:PAB1-binding protein PBP1
MALLWVLNVFPGVVIAQIMPAAQAASGGKGIMKRTISRIAAGAGIALAGILIPALGASASTQPAPVQHYSWATGFDSGTSAPTWITENFLIKSQSLKDRTGSAENNHSLTETYVRDAAGNAFEFGVTADTFDPTLQPTLFTTAWTAGAFDGYQAGFVSTSSVKPGLFQPPVGSSPEFGYSISKGTVSFTYGGKIIGYIPASHWPGGFGSGGSSQTYGEVWNNTPGGTVYPSMNGRVSNYKTSNGSHLTSYGVSSPYRLTGAGGTGFTFGS